VRLLHRTQAAQSSPQWPPRSTRTARRSPARPPAPPRSTVSRAAQRRCYVDTTQGVPAPCPSRDARSNRASTGLCGLSGTRLSSRRGRESALTTREHDVAVSGSAATRGRANECGDRPFRSSSAGTASVFAATGGPSTTRSSPTSGLPPRERALLRHPLRRHRRRARPARRRRLPADLVEQ
jgi:hypothetical protein